MPPNPRQLAQRARRLVVGGIGLLVLDVGDCDWVCWRLSEAVGCFMSRAETGGVLAGGGGVPEQAQAHGGSLLAVFRMPEDVRCVDVRFSDVR